MSVHCVTCAVLSGLCKHDGAYEAHKPTSLQWTTNPPTEPGYWLVHDPSWNWELRSARISLLRDGGLYLTIPISGGDTLQGFLLDYPDAQWYGPIERPPDHIVEATKKEGL